MEAEPKQSFAAPLRLLSEKQVETSGILGTRRGFTNIRWYEYTFLLLAIIAALLTDGLSIARLIKLGSLRDPDFAYGILILVHSIFLVAFLVTGIFYQRITDIIAFLISAILLTIYVVAHYFTRRNADKDHRDTQPKLRLVRLILTVFFNVCFIPWAVPGVRYYQREEFSKRVFGAFPIARVPLRLYNIFACIARISTMLSISTLVLNLYNFTKCENIDRILLIVGLPLVFLWLGLGIGMVRLESLILSIFFYILSLFQLAFLGYTLYTTIQFSSSIDDRSPAPDSSTATSTQSMITFVPIINVLYACVSCNLLSHLLSIILAICCSRNFNKGLKEKVFNNRIDQWFHARFFNKK